MINGIVGRHNQNLGTLQHNMPIKINVYVSPDC